jgi:O-antigen biosynthesis protein WbqP
MINSLFNLILALLILLILTPLMVLITSLIFLVDGEYPLYFSRRIGKDNKSFLMPKFRTMQSTTPQEATHLLEDPEQYLLSTGLFLRKYSLDELPQIISVLLGDMVFVGPRPALYNQHDLIALREDKNINHLKPGITGWAQVNGRDELSIEEKVRYDEEYLAKASLGFDIFIIWLTLVKVLKKEGVSH